MKKMRDIKGMSILTLHEGKQLGRVRTLLVDPLAAQVVALVLDKQTAGKELQVVATANIHSVGQAAITVQDRSSLVPISRIPRFQALAREKIAIRGKLVVTENGEKLGRVSEMIIDVETFHIQAILLKGLGRSRRIPAEQVRTIGPDVVVVQENVPPPTVLRPNDLPAKTPPQVAELALEEFPPETEFIEEIIVPGELAAIEEAEPAIPPVSTLEEALPLEPVKDIAPAIPPAPTLEDVLPPEPLQEITPPIEHELFEHVAPTTDPLLPEPAEQAIPDAPPEQGNDNPWQRWVRRLRRGKEPESSVEESLAESGEF